METYLNALLTQMNRLGASDLFLSTNRKPAFRIQGRIANSDGQALTANHMQSLCTQLLDSKRQIIFNQQLDTHACINNAENGRFRISFFHHHDGPGMVIRAIRHPVPSPEQLGLPEDLKRVILQKRGLVLFTGPAGSGKSTSMAAMLQFRNQNDASHIITLEEPVEYILPQGKSIINQREIGPQALSYESALENALRQSPDVLCIGEARNANIIEQALYFADTGHLITTTLHATGAAQALERILQQFPHDKRENVQQMLARQLHAIVAQQLVPAKDGKLVAAFEVLTGTPLVQDLVARGNFQGLGDTMQKGAQSGMQTMDQSLYNLYRSGRIDAETALEFAHSYRDMRLRIRLQAPDPAETTVA